MPEMQGTKEEAMVEIKLRHPEIILETDDGKELVANWELFKTSLWRFWTHYKWIMRRIFRR